MLKWDAWWTEAHQDACQHSLRLLRRQPWSSLMTIVMIAITLMLAVLCWMIAAPITELNADWHRNDTLSVYLKPALGAPEQQAFLQKIQALPQVKSATLTSPAEGLVLLAQQEGMQDIAQSLPYNPLPAMIQIIPSPYLPTPEAIQQFSKTLQVDPNVAEVKFDSDWLERLYQGLSFLKHLVYLLTILFALAVILVIGNTLRLLISTRQEEIQVLQLLGASDIFIRRPFLYTSLWYGFTAAVLAILFSDSLLFMLRMGLNEWANSYSIHVMISLLPLSWMLGLLGISIGLSWTGARLTLKYYL